MPNDEVKEQTTSQQAQGQVEAGDITVVNDGDDGKKNKEEKPLPQHPSVVAITIEDSQGKILNVINITDKIYQLNEDGTFKKDEATGEYIKNPDNKFTVEQVQEDIGNDQSVGVYRLVMTDKDGERTVYKANLQNKVYIKSYDDVDFSDGKSLEDKIRDGNISPEHTASVEGIGTQIENAKAEVKSSEPAKATLEFGSETYFNYKNTLKTHLLAAGTLIAGTAIGAAIGVIADKEEPTSDHIYLYNGAASVGTAAAMVGMGIELGHVGKGKISEYPDVTAEIEVNAKPLEGKPESNVMDATGYDEYSATVGTLIKAAKKGENLQDALDPNSELGKKLNDIAVKNNESYNKTEVENLVKLIETSAKDRKGRLTDEVETEVYRLAAIFGSTGSGEYVKDQLNFPHRNTGWGVEK